MSRGIAGPFRSERFVADTNISTKRAWLGTYTVINAGAAPITVTFYDNIDGSTSNPIESAIIGTTASAAFYPNGDTLNGLTIRSSSWTSVQAFVRWAPA